MDIRKEYSINIMAVRENGKMNMDITPDMVISEKETMLVLGKNRDIQKCFHI